MIKSFRNLSYYGGTDLVRCCQCDTDMLLPSGYSACPVCGAPHRLTVLEQGVEYDIPSWDEEIVTDNAYYIEGIDHDGNTVAVLAPNT